MTSTSETRAALEAWPALERIVYVPRTQNEYENLVRLLDQLIDQVGEHESHSLASLMDVVGVLIEKYENEHVPELKPD
jgi:HTH-type transcriptional regulator/antitoxin HigA